MLASVLGTAALLRPAEDEEHDRSVRGGVVLPSTRLVGYLLLPLTVLIGADLTSHGHVTPGGGFQGGVVLATAAHFLYVAGSFPAVRRIRPAGLHELLEGMFAGAFAALGLAVLVAAGGFLANPLAKGSFGQLVSAGTVPLLNGIVAVEIAASTIVLIGAFLDQEILVKKKSGGR
jgi:multicomponent Na+:H+ antiporter subunit B